MTAIAFSIAIASLALVAGAHTAWRLRQLEVALDRLGVEVGHLNDRYSAHIHHTAAPDHVSLPVELDT